jgi:hypothetical protein
MQTRVEEISREISKLERELYEIRKACPHENFKSEYKANTGNYDPSADCYWLNVKCLDCGEFMMFDSVENRAEYYKYSPNKNKKI